MESSTPQFSVIDIKTRERIGQDIQDLSNTIKPTRTKDIQVTLQAIAYKGHVFSSTQGIFSRIMYVGP